MVVQTAGLARAIRGFTSVVGAGNVQSRAEELDAYARPMSPVDAGGHAPVAVVSPASVEEIRALLRIASQEGVPLWPVSTGRNFGYGSTLVARPGTVLLELRRLNRILDLDPVLCTALVEPGVTYQMLHDRIAAEKLDLWLDFPAPGPLVGPIGNTLERGGGTTPYFDHLAHACGFEVVLADGTVVRTGMGGVKDTTAWQAYRYGYGPWLDGIFTQSNFGIVTKMGVQLMLRPETSRTYIASWAGEGDVARAVDAIRPLRLDGTIGNNGTFLNDTLALTDRRRGDVYDGPGAITRAAVEKARPKGLGAWLYSYSIYGRADRGAADDRAATAALTRAGATVIPDVPDPMQVGVLALGTFSLFNWVGGGGLAWFSPVCAARGTEAAAQMQLAREIMEAHAIDFMTGATMDGREMLNVMPLVFDRGDPAATARADACMRALYAGFGARGWGFYRVGIGYMDEAAEIHGAAQRDVNHRLKRALDPGNIIAPGKSGISL